MTTTASSAAATSLSDPLAVRLPDPLTEAALAEHVFPLFSRVRARGWSPGHPDGEIYLANHSLGRPLDRTAEDVREALDLWYGELDHAWAAWMEAAQHFRWQVARLIGCGDPGCVAPKTSAGQGLRAVLNAIPKDRPRVVATRGEFDSGDFILKTYAARERAEVVWVEANERGVFEAEAIVEAVRRHRPDLVLVSQVFFVTGQVLEGVEEVVSAAREAGALSLIDAYHGAGVIDLGFDRLGADFMVGGSYKYTRGGPGACWLAVHPRHLKNEPTPVSADGVFTLDTGWFAKADSFGYRRTEEPIVAAGGDAWLEATPPVLTWYQARAGLELTNAVGVGRLRAYSLRQQAFLRGELERRGVEVADLGLPAEQRGAFLLLPAGDTKASTARLRESGVASDARRCPRTGRAYIRLCPDLLTTEAEMAEAAERIAVAL